MSIMAMARDHLGGKHAATTATGCALCPACPNCGGKGFTVQEAGNGRFTIDCRSCGATGSQKGSQR